MKSERKYLYILIAVLAIYVVYELQKPKEVDWTQTYHFQDKIPFGTYVTHDLIEDMFDNGEADHVFDNFYGQEEDYGSQTNQLVLSTQIGLTELDLERLGEHLNEGRTIMLAAAVHSSGLADTLDFEIGYDDIFFVSDFTEVQESLKGELKTRVRLEIPGFKKKEYDFPPIALGGSFKSWNKDFWQALAFNENGSAVLMKREFGEGTLYLSTMPLAFTNYFVLEEETSEFAASVLSLFPKAEPLAHNEYYRLGRIEPRSKIRFFLRNEALKWSIFILIIATMLFIIFESKRRQRIIPVVKPLENKTLEFVNVLGRLYYRQSSHTKLARKRILYWKDFVRSHYNLKVDQLDAAFSKELIRKSGRRESTINDLVILANKVMEDKSLGESEMMILEKLLNEFYDIK